MPRSAQAEAAIAVLGDRPVTYLVGLTKALIKLNPHCSPLDALLVCQMLYWTGKGARTDGWIWKTREEWFDELGLSRRNQQTVRRHLTELGILEEKLMGMPAKMHFRLNDDKLEALVLLAYVVDPEEERELLAIFPVGTDRTNSEGTDRTNSDGTDRANKLVRTVPRSDLTTDHTPESTTESIRGGGWAGADYLTVPEMAAVEDDGSLRIDFEEGDVEYTCPACKATSALPSSKSRFVCPACKVRLSGFIGGVLLYRPPRPPSKRKMPDPELCLGKVLGDRCQPQAVRVACSSPEQADQVRQAYESDPEHFLWWVRVIMQRYFRDRKLRWDELAQAMLDEFHHKVAEKEGKETPRYEDRQQATINPRPTSNFDESFFAYLREVSAQQSAGPADAEVRDADQSSDTG